MWILLQLRIEADLTHTSLITKPRLVEFLLALNHILLPLLYLGRLNHSCLSRRLLLTLWSFGDCGWRSGLIYLIGQFISFCDDQYIWIGTSNTLFRCGILSLQSQVWAIRCLQFYGLLISVVSWIFGIQFTGTFKRAPWKRLIPFGLNCQTSRSSIFGQIFDSFICCFGDLLPTNSCQVNFVFILNRRRIWDKVKRCGSIIVKVQGWANFAVVWGGFCFKKHRVDANLSRGKWATMRTTLLPHDFLFEVYV